VRLRDFDPDLILVDVAMPTKSGYEICEFVKSSLGHLHTRVVLLAGAQETVDENEAKRVRVDGVLKKPFEASLMLQTVKPLLEAAAQERTPDGSLTVTALNSATPELVRAAVTIALDAVLPNLIEEITQKVLSVLDTKNA
jgi:DNA-binding response OmpR family regulator